MKTQKTEEELIKKALDKQLKIFNNNYVPNIRKSLIRELEEFYLEIQDEVEKATYNKQQKIIANLRKQLSKDLINATKQYKDLNTKVQKIVSHGDQYTHSEIIGILKRALKDDKE